MTTLQHTQMIKAARASIYNILLKTYGLLKLLDHPFKCYDSAKMNLDNMYSNTHAHLYLVQVSLIRSRHSRINSTFTLYKKSELGYSTTTSDLIRYIHGHNEGTIRHLH
jgi:hypothetical protein